MRVKFAPLFIPFRRRLQTFAVLQWMSCAIIVPWISVALMMSLFLSRFALLVFLYCFWLYEDWDTPRRGGRRIQWFRQWDIWRHLRDYFPIGLVKTGEIDPTRNYILGYHPHGIAGFGAVCNFATEANGFSKKFPGLTPYLLTLRSNFYWPILRGYYMCLGLCDVSRESIHYLMTQKTGGHLAIIAVGGAEEALQARPGSYALILLKRKGFVRQALVTGASLIPCYSFGENDLYLQMENPEGSSLRKFQATFKKYCGFSPPLFHGRGIFQYTFGFMPYRKPVVTVVGEAIIVEKAIPSPSQEEIDELHDKYLNALTKLFDEHKGNHGIDENTHLRFI